MQAGMPARARMKDIARPVGPSQAARVPRPVYSVGF
jgi:hypothetical protein